MTASRMVPKSSVLTEPTGLSIPFASIYVELQANCGCIEYNIWTRRFDINMGQRVNMAVRQTTHPD